MISTRYFDHIAIALSGICIVHCLAVPLIVAVLPMLALSLGDGSHFHGLMLWLVVPTSVIGFSLGYRVHKRPGIVALGALGVATLAAVATWGHDTLSAAPEVVLSVLGSLVLGGAHWLNFREVRRFHQHG